MQQELSPDTVKSANQTVRDLEQAMLKQSDMPLVDFDLDHLFNGGMYARTIYIPRGCFATGRLHYTDHIFFVMQGRISIVINGQRHILQAPAVLAGMADTKKAAYAMEDAMLVTVEITEQTEVKAAEDELYEPLSPEIKEANASAIKLVKYDMGPVYKALEDKR